MKVISLEYPKFIVLACEPWVIKEKNTKIKYELYYNLPTEEGSSGSRIILPIVKKLLVFISKEII